MSEKVFVTIARQTGIDAKTTGEKLASLLDIPYYDNQIMADLYPDSNYHEYFAEAGEHLPADKKYGSEIGGNRLYLTINEEIFNAQRTITMDLAKKDKCGVFISRCADDILSGEEKIVKVFLFADKKLRVNKVMLKEDLNKGDAEQFVDRMDNSKGIFYNYYTDKKWGDRENYDLCINVTKIPIDSVANIIKSYIDKKYA